MTLMATHFALSFVFEQVRLELLCVDIENNCVKKTNKDKPLLTTAGMYARNFSFWQYKVYADIRWGSLARRRQTTRRFFSAFGVYIFGSFRMKANIIIRYYLVCHWLSTDPKQMTLNDLADEQDCFYCVAHLNCLFKLTAVSGGFACKNITRFLFLLRWLCFQSTNFISFIRPILTGTLQREHVYLIQLKWFV